MWVKSHFRKLYGKQLTFLCHHDFWKWKCTRNLDKVTQKRKISRLTCLVLVSWSSFLVWNHWAMFMNHEWIIMTSSNGIFSALLAFFAGHTPVTGEFTSQRPVTRNFDIFFDLRPNKRLRKEPWGQRFGAPSRSLWRYCNKNWSTETNPKWSSYMVWAPYFQSMWPIDVIWRHTPLWTLVQVIIWTDVDRSISAHDIRLGAISTINHQN